MSAYTYYITHRPTGQSYYGVRYAKGCDPSDLWITYFTSSNRVKKLIKESGKDQFDVQVRKVFTTAEAAISWETRVVRKIMRWPNVINKCAWPAMTSESHLKSHETKSLIGPDGLTGYQRAGKTWRENKHRIDPDTGLTVAELQKRRRATSRIANGTERNHIHDISGDKNPSKKTRSKG